MFNIILLGITSLLTDISTEMVYPLLPFFLTTKLGATPLIVGTIEGIAESLASLLKVFSGYFSDRIKRRKPFAIAGYGASTLGKILLYTAFSWPAVLAGRVIDRFGKGIRTAPRDALIAESSSEETRGRAFGLHRTMDTLGATIGVLLAYYFISRQHVDFRQIFLYSLIPAIMGVMALFFVRERGAAKISKEKPSLNWNALDRRLKSFLVLMFIFTLGNSSNQFLLLRAKDVGFDAKTILLLYLTYNLVYNAASYPAGAISDRIGRKALIVAGYVVYCLVYLGFALASTPASIWALFAAYGLYMAFTEGVEKAFISDIAPENVRGTMIGLHATLVGIGLLPASLIAGALWNAFGAQVPFYFGGFMGILAAVGIALLI
ncbi:Predicted arabinose efflux permease, MFS family [Caldanaerovirga acetigignens]|uniref:Predicted arabinose efflux permease, MFS family n=1 Tax=Caldanaerovirga acetigignens TaxID=447595 RepID=A0A1M7HGM9_9FIRM|nr:MFS transporter [Caldanaerovirga acetigignens]SHM27609.1 Predicted arabinose efflux permease, MFS family [Caldanaerovirga acetigignens]